MHHDDVAGKCLYDNLAKKNDLAVCLWLVRQVRAQDHEHHNWPEPCFLQRALVVVPNQWAVCQQCKAYTLNRYQRVWTNAGDQVQVVM